jgi:cation:H+ antiporter
MEQFFESLPRWANALFFLLGMAVITKGADLFTDSAVRLAELSRIPKVIIGATVVSLATTAPEFSVSFVAALLNRPQTTIGNAIGSTICNIGLILGSCVLVRAASSEKKIVLQQGIFMLAAAIGVTVFSLGGTLEPWAGVILIGLLGGYIYYSYSTAMRIRRAKGSTLVAEKPGKGTDEALAQVFSNPHPPGQSLSRELGLVMAGGAAVVIGSILLVQNAAILARWLGIPELIIGLTLVALGTSLPEYVTAFTSTLKGHSDLGVGNIIGANFLDIAWVIGFSSLVRPLPIERQTLVLDYPFMLLLMGLLVYFGSRNSKIERLQGGKLFAVYILYLALMFSLFV